MLKFLNFSKIILTKGSLQKKYGIVHTLVRWVGLKKSFSIKKNNKKHGQKCLKLLLNIHLKAAYFYQYGRWSDPNGC